MASYRQVLANLFRLAGLRQSDVAARMGYKSASAIGMMLSGQRAIGRKELELMCQIANTTLVELAAQSDDLKLANTYEAIAAADIMDSMPQDMREDALTMLKAMRAKAKHFSS